MNLVLRWSTTVSLIAGTLLGSFLAGGMRALALSQDQIVEILKPVPVFTLANKEGAPLVASTTPGQQGDAVAGAFVSRQDAQQFLANIQKNNPELARDVQVIPVSLGEIYKMSQSRGLAFDYVPNQQQVSTAMTLLRQSGRQINEFAGVPLFVAVQGSGQEGQQGYLTIKQGEQEVIPVYFEKEPLQSLIDRFKQQNPQGSANITIQVLNLEGMLQTLKTSNDTSLTKLVLIPSQEALQFILQNQPRATTPQPNNRPANATTPQPSNRPANATTPQPSNRPANSATPKPNNR